MVATDRSYNKFHSFEKRRVRSKFPGAASDSILIPTQGLKASMKFDPSLELVFNVQNVQDAHL